jgi:hypothetical protein
MKALRNIIINIILSVALNGCETWPLTSREEHILKITESRMLSRIFVLKKEDNCVLRSVITCVTLRQIIILIQFSRMK